jgi:hypothetical protein
MIKGRPVSRGSSGQSLVELAAGLMVLIPIILLLVDLFVCVIAVTTNDAASRDAARAAAAGRPATSSTFGAEDSSSRVKAIIGKVYSSAGYIQGPMVVGQYTADDPDTGPQNLVSPDTTNGGQYGGTYRVTTKIVVTLPASLPAMMPPNYTFLSRSEFPLTMVETTNPTPPP